MATDLKQSPGVFNGNFSTNADRQVVVIMATRFIRLGTWLFLLSMLKFKFDSRRRKIASENLILIVLYYSEQQGL